MVKISPKMLFWKVTYECYAVGC